MVLLQPAAGGTPSTAVSPVGAAAAPQGREVSVILRIWLPS